MSWLGDVAAGVTLDFKFTTRRFSTGAPFALASGAISVYKDNSTAQSTTGVTLTADFDSVTGLNHVRIDLSSDGTFYAAGSNFQVVITTGTVDSVSVVGETIAHFSIAHRPVQSLAANVITATAIASNAFTSAKFASGAFDAVWSVAARLLTAGTNIVLAKGTGVTGFNDLSAAQVNTEADTALADVGLTTTITGRIDAAVSSRLATAGYTAPDNASVTAIKAKTDSLTFTQAGNIDANIQYVNDVLVTGTGALGNEWGP